jgi:dihydrolipoamide dehydrogenase
MTERKQFDICVIGSGPGGYIAAIKAAQLGRSVALVEKDAVGGTCLNVGCIPTKTLLAHAAVLHTVRHASQYGITTGPISFEYRKMKERKDQIIAKLSAGLQGLFRANKITFYSGAAQFESPHELKIHGKDNLFIRADKIILATGSIPLDLRAFPCDHERILNSTSLLNVTEVPRTLAIVGGGYIGCEFASLFAELGTKVTILEALPTILAPQGAQIAQFMTRSFTARGIDIRTNVSVKAIKNQQSHVRIELSEGEPFEADLALIAVGRKMYTEGLAVEKAGLPLNERGGIDVSETMETAVPGIYAIGDVTGKSMLAHVASHQGVVAAMNAAGHPAVMHYEAVPAVIFTAPEVATVGFTLEQAQEAGYSAVLGSFPFQALGKSQAALETDGFAQVVIDSGTGTILGAQVIGHDAATLIAEITLAISNELTAECLIDTIHAHPTLSEAWHEAAMIARGTPLHFPPRSKP